MSSYLSNILTQTTSRYNTLRRTLLASEDDGDTENDTHICRVLRAYYTEKGRQFPQWLPPDPNDRKAVTPQPHMREASGYFSNIGGRSSYGAPPQQTPASQRGSLSDLWDSPAQATTSTQPSSLRNARRPVNPPQPSAASLAPPQARPLPSQRAGSYQSPSTQRPVAEPVPSAGSGGGGTAQDRLKARLWGGARAGSPGSGGAAGSAMGQAGGAPNPYDQPYTPSGGQGNPYDTGGSNRRYGR